jgi:hypothetical protein
VLAAHAVLMFVACVFPRILTTGGVGGYDDDAGPWTGPPAAVSLACWAGGVLTAVLVVRMVGRRHPGRLPYWLTGTACWVIAPLAWLAVSSAASEPEAADRLLLFYLFTPVGWVFLVPALLIGAVLTAVLASMNS